LVSEDGNPVLCSFIFGNLVPTQKQLEDTLEEEGLGYMDLYEESRDVLAFGSLVMEVSHYLSLIKCSKSHQTRRQSLVHGKRGKT